MSVIVRPIVHSCRTEERKTMGYTTWESVERRRKRRKIILIVLLLLLSIAAGIGGYWYYGQWEADRPQKKYEELKL